MKNIFPNLVSHSACGKFRFVELIGKQLDPFPDPHSRVDLHSEAKFNTSPYARGTLLGGAVL
jgi:hypothetical protein